MSSWVLAMWIIASGGYSGAGIDHIGGFETKEKCETALQDINKGIPKYRYGSIHGTCFLKNRSK